MKQLLSISLGLALGLSAASLHASEINFADPTSWNVPFEEYTKIRINCEKNKNPDDCYKFALLMWNTDKNGDYVSTLSGNSAVACRRGSSEGCTLFYEMSKICHADELGWLAGFYAEESEKKRLDYVKDDKDAADKGREFARLVMQDSCKNGVYSSCYILSRFDKKKSSSTENFKILQKGVEKREDLSCYILGTLNQQQGKLEEAEKVFKIGCDAGGRLSCLNLSRLLGRDDMLGKNNPRAIEAKEKACRLGSSAACSSLAEVVFGLFMAEDQEKKRPYLRRACFYGDAESCYAEAMEIKKDFFEERKDKGSKSVNSSESSDGKRELSPEELKALDEDIKQFNEAMQKSKVYLSKACFLDYPPACGTLGKNEYEAKNYQNAKFWIEKGAKSSYTMPAKYACKVMLAIMYMDGKGVRQDFSKAVRHLEEASGRDEQACMLLASIYMNGVPGVGKDLKQAKEYFGKACDQGYEEGCQKYAELNKRGI